jgi:Zn-dependent peptidase ImmA (M78 family)
VANARADVLRGFQAAQRVHHEAAVRENYLRPGGRIDVYKLAADLDIPVMFQDLDGLLGVYFADPTPGIMLTKKRPAAVQRFTCAHELGHFYLQHEESLDSEMDIGFALSGGHSGNERERQADAFAFSFLMPKWLLIQNLKHLASSGFRLNAPTSIDQAQVVYQLSLRVGCSYSATITTLQHYRVLPDATADALRRIEPKKIKEHLLSEVMVPDWHRDVWLVTEADNGGEIDASPEDLFVVRVHEPSTAGYRTKLNQLEEHGFTILKEGYVTSFDFGMASKDEVIVGTFPTYEAVTQHGEPGHAAIDIVQGRPWEAPELSVASLHLDLDLRMPQQGLSVEERQMRIKVAATND